MSEHILIATADEPTYRRLHGMLDREEGRVLSDERVGSLGATVARLKQGPVDAILLDLELPGSAGLAGLQLVRAAAPRLPVVLLCTANSEHLARQALQRNAQGYLRKDQNADHLLAQVLGGCIRLGHQQKLRRRAEATLESIGDAVITTDMLGSVDYLNCAAEAMTGWSRGEAMGQPIERVMPLLGSSTEGDVPNLVLRALQQGRPQGMDVGMLLVRRDGTQVAIEDSVAPIIGLGGHISGAVVVFHDVTEARSRSVHLAYLAQHDFLTRLPNRVLLNDRISQAISLAQRNGHSTTLMFLDLDNFKLINDSFGHASGDQLLQAVAQRLSDCVRGSDTVCRNGGDEFVVLLAEGHSQHDASVAAQKILAALAQPHQIGQQEVQVTSSIGISVYPADATDAKSLLKHADLAMYHAKQAGRNNYQFFHEGMNEQTLEQQPAEQNLEPAQQRHERVLYYRPRVDLATGGTVGAEAMLGWRHSDHGLLMANSFVSLAEASGLIVPIGKWRLREACAQARAWQQQGLASVTVNLTASELCHPNTVPGVSTSLHATRLPPKRLQLAISETELMHDFATCAMALWQLKVLGVRLELTGFGIGGCSLHELLELPFDALRINRSLTQLIGKGDSKSSIPGALMALAARLNLQVIADGVETQVQLDLLKAERCAEAQGLLFGKALSALAFTRRLVAG
ncbi:diguanylate cyclase [Pseudomonas sp. CAU 1711]|uniref:putative bifunctional diguanylate cyclase/phosphodiesterase n=1 Tax=Pseudomonas sp. CAU 1711 TaxID=3140356 RepID=UPI00325FF402